MNQFMERLICYVYWSWGTGATKIVSALPNTVEVASSAEEGEAVGDKLARE